MEIEELFGRLVDDLKKTRRLKIDRHLLPDANIYSVLERFVEKIGYTEDDSDELIILDFIAGMTDNYVVNCLDEIFVPKAIT